MSKKINRIKRINKARNMRKNNRGKGTLSGPMLGACGWINIKGYLMGFK